MAKRILVVDDDADIREATEAVLAGAGYEVVQAAGGDEAIQKLGCETFDLVMLDVMMETDTQGFHLAYRIRKDERHQDVPIIMLTCIEDKTGVSLEPEKSGDYLPVDAFLRKPVDSTELKSKVAELIG